MLLTVYIIFQLLVIITMAVTLYNDSVVPSVITMVLSGFLAIGAWVINTGVKYVWDSGIGAYVAEEMIYNTPYLASINIGIFGLALMYFFSDLFTHMGKDMKGLGNLKLSGKKGNKGGF